MYEHLEGEKKHSKETRCDTTAVSDVLGMRTAMNKENTTAAVSSAVFSYLSPLRYLINIQMKTATVLSQTSLKVKKDVKPPPC